MKSWFALVVCIGLAACASAPTAPQPADLLNDSLFSAPSQRIAAADVLAPSAEMKRYIDTAIRPGSRLKGAREALVEALSKRAGLKLDYDSAITRNAAQAFEARSGNCLSLVIMTAALARELGLPVYYQKVYLPAVWSRSGDLYFSSDHVNLSLGVPIGERDSRLTIDFLPPEELRGMRSRTIAESAVIAMYMNNRAAEALAAAQVNDAYWWAREAVMQAPSFLAAYNTLAVVYQRHGRLDEARRVLEHVLQQEPDNTSAMSNLVGVLRRGGQDAAAQRLATRLAQIEPHPPYHFFNLGLAAMREADYERARELFTKEVRRAAFNHEFHLGLALANSALGDYRQAHKHLKIALENSATGQDREIYTAKLERLRSYLR